MLACPLCRKTYPDGATECSDDGRTLLPEELLGTVDAPLDAGTMVGEYRIERKLGSGTFGDVYAGEQPLIGKRVAVKLLHRKLSAEAEVVSRFVAEARAVNRIRHRNIIDIFSFGVLPDKRQYFVMELLDGLTLGELLAREGHLSMDVALPIFQGIASALDAAHEAGITHRDLKPDNVFLAVEKEGGYFPKLLDFGVAKLAGEDVAHKTATGMAIGTPRYMSPEQCRAKKIDHKADIYSLGVLIHEALTGEPLFDGEGMMEVLFKHMNEPPRPMSTVRSELSEVLDAPVLAMLAKRPKDRPDSAGAAVKSLAAVVHGASHPSSARSSAANSGPVDSRKGAPKLHDSHYAPTATSLPGVASGEGSGLDTETSSRPRSVGASHPSTTPRTGDVATVAIRRPRSSSASDAAHVSGVSPSQVDAAPPTSVVRAPNSAPGAVVDVSSKTELAIPSSRSVPMGVSVEAADPDETSAAAVSGPFAGERTGEGATSTLFRSPAERATSGQRPSVGGRESRHGGGSTEIAPVSRVGDTLLEVVKPKPTLERSQQSVAAPPKRSTWPLFLGAAALVGGAAIVWFIAKSGGDSASSSAASAPASAASAPVSAASAPTSTARGVESTASMPVAAASTGLVPTTVLTSEISPAASASAPASKATTAGTSRSSGSGKPLASGLHKDIELPPEIGGPPKK